MFSSLLFFSFSTLLIIHERAVFAYRRAVFSCWPSSFFFPKHSSIPSLFYTFVSNTNQALIYALVMTKESWER